MSTSVSYRSFRRYYNDHASDFERFGSRVHNPLNERQKPDKKKSEQFAAWTRMFIAISVFATGVMLVMM
jgi:hypothetical protein